MQNLAHSLSKGTPLTSTLTTPSHYRLKIISKSLQFHGFAYFLNCVNRKCVERAGLRDSQATPFTVLLNRAQRFSVSRKLIFIHFVQINCSAQFKSLAVLIFAFATLHQAFVVFGAQNATVCAA